MTVESNAEPTLHPSGAPCSSAYVAIGGAPRRPSWATAVIGPLSLLKK